MIEVQNMYKVKTVCDMCGAVSESETYDSKHVLDFSQTHTFVNNLQEPGKWFLTPNENGDRIKCICQSCRSNV